MVGELVLADQDRVVLDLTLRHTFNANMLLRENGVLPKVRLEPEDDLGWRGSLRWQRSLSRFHRLQLECGYERWNLGRSATVSGVTEPESEGGNFSAVLSLMKAF
ncbi:hypothetical protein [Candidatus Reidiella endopervernicosa]|uniref:Uncharacterized protein n=1 Tax=Candidatus Reidiella endopervernicosa TaxID=2738883 RepID=A0A6N0HUV7_9GAMM|nr:hypothetical protein [Candidatus Reidiella endopervernicosa]QKQ25991.1 hypothetical protein HUE57_06610 [Candidatus Reidiella endopervernicosa]